MSKTTLVIGACAIAATVGFLIAISYTAGLWPPDAAAPVKTEETVVASTWADRLGRVGTAGILVGGVIALTLAFWRGYAADRQARTAQQGLLNERYQKGAEMLGSDVRAVRLAGISALGRLASDHPEPYYLQIMQLLCAFVRHPTGLDAPRVGEDDPVREDVRETVAWIGSHRNHAIEKNSKYKPDLTNAYLRKASLNSADLSRALMADVDLQGAWLHQADLSETHLWNAKLHRATLIEANLSAADLLKAKLPRANLGKACLLDANLSGTDLSGDASSSDSRTMLQYANLTKANLSGANLTGAWCYGTKFDNANLLMTNLSGADLRSDARTKVTGLTQEQVNHACWDHVQEPGFTDTVDGNTGKAIVPPTIPCSNSAL